MSESPGIAASSGPVPPALTISRPAAPSFPGARRALPFRRPGRGISTVVVLAFVLLARIAHGLVTNPWDRFPYWFLRPTILDGPLTERKD